MGCLRLSPPLQLPFPNHACVPKQCLPRTGQAIPIQKALTHIPAAPECSWQCPSVLHGCTILAPSPLPPGVSSHLAILTKHSCTLCLRCLIPSLRPDTAFYRTPTGEVRPHRPLEIRATANPPIPAYRMSKVFPAVSASASGPHTFTDYVWAASHRGPSPCGQHPSYKIINKDYRPGSKRKDLPQAQIKNP